MFTKTNRNDPLVESIKNVMEQNDLLRRVETAVNEHFGVVSKKALPHEYHAEYDAIFEETKKCAMAEDSDKDKKVATPEHHRAEAIRIHKQIKENGKLPHLVAKKKEHEEAYRKMTGNKVKYPDDLNEKVKMTKDQMANLDGDPKFTGNDLAHLRAGTHKKKAAAGELEEEKMTSSEKEKEKKLKAKYDPSGMKKSMVDQYGKKGKQVYFATIRKKAMNESIDTILEEIRNNLEEELTYVYENYDEATFNEYVASLTEEQIEILGLNEYVNLRNNTTQGGGSSQNATPPSGGGIPANAGRSIDPRQKLGGSPMPSRPSGAAPQPQVSGRTPLNGGAFGSNTPLKVGGNLPSTSAAAKPAQRPNAPAARPAQRPGARRPKTADPSRYGTWGGAMGTMNEDTYNDLIEELNYVYENYDEATFNEYVDRLTEEQLESLGLIEETPAGRGRGLPPNAMNTFKDRTPAPSTDRVDGTMGRTAPKFNPGSVRPTDDQRADAKRSQQSANYTAAAKARPQKTVMGGAGSSGTAPTGGGISTLAASGAKNMKQQIRMMDNPETTRKSNMAVQTNKNRSGSTTMSPKKPIKESFEQFLRNKFLKG